MRLSIVLAGFFLAGLPAYCQTTINGVRIYTEPANLKFLVDGQLFRGAADLFWPAASKHTITVDDPQQLGGGAGDIMYSYGGAITTNLGNPDSSPLTANRTVLITADPALKWVKISFAMSYKVTLKLSQCGDALPECAAGGIVKLGGAAYDRDAVLWVPANSTLHAEAYPKDGYVFLNWGRVNGFTVPPTPFMIDLPMPAPEFLTPLFAHASDAMVDAQIDTNPSGLQMYLDRTAYTAPKTLQWQWNSVHAVGAPEVQFSNSANWVFTSWSDGGAINHDITAPNHSTLFLTANFVRGTSATFRTFPAGLKLTVDGTQAWQSYAFVWAPGTKHTISAPATQTDSSGHKYEFVSWSNGKAASFEYTVGDPDTPDMVSATYRAIGQVTIASDPSGVTVRVDGQDCATPCVVERPAGTTLQVDAPATVQNGDNTRLLFAGWQDSAAASRSVTAIQDKTGYTAQFKTQYRLALSTDPAGGASFQTNPASSDRFFDSGTAVGVSASLNPGFKVFGWSGDLSGRALAGSISLDAPRAAVLQLIRVPAITSPGVRSAASDAAQSGVAPGSLISIYGANLSSDLAVGPASPLAQTLANVTVRVDGSFLPLLFVSPGQINAQLVSGLDPGTHQLIVRLEGQPETAVNFDVVRNAPGLFTTIANDRSIGVFSHTDGRPVTIQDPAAPGETISAYGTGMGPYRTAPPDGFLVSESAPYAAADPVTVTAAGQQITPLYAGRTGLGVGVDVVRFVAPAASSDAKSVDLKVSVNGVESNTVSLPVSAGSASNAADSVPPAGGNPEN